MGSAATRATVYLDPELYKALRLKAVETSQSVSKLVNDAIKESLVEDADDMAAFEEKGQRAFNQLRNDDQEAETRWPAMKSILKSLSRKTSVPYQRGI